jgi:hypothetical protein
MLSWARQWRCNARPAMCILRSFVTAFHSVHLSMHAWDKSRAHTLVAWAYCFSKFRRSVASSSTVARVARTSGPRAAAPSTMRSFLLGRAVLC